MRNQCSEFCSTPVFQVYSTSNCCRFSTFKLGHKALFLICFWLSGWSRVLTSRRRSNTFVFSFYAQLLSENASVPLNGYAQKSPHPIVETYKINITDDPPFSTTISMSLSNDSDDSMFVEQDSSAISIISSASDDPNAGVGLSDPQFDHERRRMLDLVNKLHSTGYVSTCRIVWQLTWFSVQVDIDLPQIAVIGSQSAGKSSLIESISGITLPRASGTCTR